MNVEPAYVTLAVYGLTQVGALIWILASARAEARVLKIQMQSVRDELSKLSNVLITLSDFSGRLNLFEERLTLTGKRLDEASNRMNKHIDEYHGKT